MPLIASRHRNKQANKDEDGFSLTELIAGLLVASLLVVGLIDIVNRFARTTQDVKTTVADLRDSRLLGVAFQELERADPESVSVSLHEVRAHIGGSDLRGRIIKNGPVAVLEWSHPTGVRSFDVPPKTYFEQSKAGAIAIMISSSDAPLAVAIPRRSVRYNCQFDTVARKCR